VHSFEPSRGGYQGLSDKFKNHPNVLLRDFGLGKASGEFDLFYDNVGSGMASLSKRKLDHLGIAFEQSEKVTIHTLDEYCEMHRIQCIDLLKIDVEGHELDVLLGGGSMFRERKIGMVSFEFGGCNIDTRTFLVDFWQFFKANGMNRFFRITPSGHLVPLFQYKELDEQFRTTNFFVSRE
jgi:FkbM family methyltransferase